MKWLNEWMNQSINQSIKWLNELINYHFSPWRNVLYAVLKVLFYYYIISMNFAKNWTHDLGVTLDFEPQESTK